jgi:transposase-like protein
VDETVVKIAGEKYYIWFIIDSETRFILGFHLSPYRNSKQAFVLLNSVKGLGTPSAIVSDRYSAYKVPVKSLFDDNVKYIRVESFKDDISNNLIESFHHQFKAWYKTKQGFSSFESANSQNNLLQECNKSSKNIFPAPKCTHVGYFLVCSAIFSTSKFGSFIPACCHLLMSFMPSLFKSMYESKKSFLIFKFFY